MKIGILGGTFDPIHFGHINPVLEVKQALELDQIWLMPNHIPPHKQQPNSTTAHRLAMAHLVCQQYPELKLCDIEVKRDSPSYSVTTLQTLKQQQPQDQLLFIMGMDSFINLPSWYQWQQLLDLCHIVVCQRPGWSLSDNPKMQQLLNRHYGDKNALAAAQAQQQSSGLILPVTITEQPYSSTEIRQQLANNQLQDDAIPTVVSDYIRQHNLYTS
ncbi:nicotinate-nucleotide adenylyltransferase [Shewanella sp. Isolate11]|uniref:nicotinate-nucleotide adenylyltransferase n=1 Tax=Shewanella sp. Isolate11 TaxID=2908530 RepID=UPI001EFDC977|nr:nicotinate-nucleotide adenylyltransferase [Shewanella sp. Isolate11]MCG9697417.1 nicotinate-nucleotide adenylyltransferase [Shewanella sp. Isolate11]